MLLWEIVPCTLDMEENMSKQLITLEEANEWSAEKIQRAIGAKSLELVNHGMTENEAKIFIASLLNLDRALANKNF